MSLEGSATAELSIKSFLWGFAAEGAGDGGDVVIDHADVGSFVASGRPHGIRVEFAADFDFVAFGAGAFDERLDVLLGDRALDEDGGDLPFNEEIDKLTDVLESGLGLGAESLDSANFKIVGASEVVEGIVGGDEDTLAIGNGGDRLAGVVVELLEFAEIGLGVLLVEIPFGWSSAARAAPMTGLAFIQPLTSIQTCGSWWSCSSLIT